jgi:hypothetical protein
MGEVLEKIRRASSEDPMYDDWIECWSCGGEGERFGYCVCQEDTCCCLHPIPPECDICNGTGVLLEGDLE